MDLSLRNVGFSLHNVGLVLIFLDGGIFEGCLYERGPMKLSETCHITNLERILEYLQLRNQTLVVNANCISAEF